MNNYERIKQMSLDEMAKFLFNNHDKIIKVSFAWDESGENICVKPLIKQWLQAESEEEQN